MIRLNFAAVIEVDESVIAIFISPSSPAAVVTLLLIASCPLFNKLARVSEIPVVYAAVMLLTPAISAASEALMPSLTVAFHAAPSVTASVINAAFTCAPVPVIV